MRYQHLPHPRRPDRRSADLVDVCLVDAILRERGLTKLDDVDRTYRFSGDLLGDSFALFVGEKKLESKDREELLAKMRTGEGPTALEVEAITYIQRDTPNRKFVRFKDGILAAFAKSFVGQPFLRDHNDYSLEARGGTILSAKLEKLEDGSKAIRMRLKLVKLWAIEGALDGTIDRFSIGWSRTDIVECSVHKARAFTECDCYPGDKIGDKVVQFVFTGAEGTEVSAVNVPAVVGTGVQSISQLAALDRNTLAGILGGAPIPSPPKKETRIMDLAQLAASLGLPPTATLAEVMAKLASLSSAADTLTVERSARASAEAELVRLRAAEEQRTLAATAAVVEASIAQLATAGKIKPGGDVEAALRRMSARDMEAFSAQVKDLLATGAQITPAGKPVVADGADPVPVVTPGAQLSGKDFIAANPEAAKWLQKAGITVEQFEKHGAHARDIVQQMGAQRS